MAEQNELLSEIKTVAGETKRWARSSFRAAYLVTGVAVAASILGSVLAGTEEVPRWLAAAVAALPAATLTISTMFRFEERAAWYWRKHRKMNRLVRALRFEDAPAEEVSREFSKIEEDMEEEWVTFGRLSGPD